MSDSLPLSEELSCVACRDLFSGSVPPPCGHSLCRACVQEGWERRPGARLHCPLCHEREEEEGPVACDCCVGQPPPPAVSTCLRCQVSLCALHLQPHLDRPAFRSHPLVQPLRDLAGRRCPEHSEMLRHYCADERRYVCADCVLEGKHSKHHVKAVRKMEEELKGILQAQLQKAEDKLKESERILKEHKEADHTLTEACLADEAQVERLGSSLQTQVQWLVGALREGAQREAQHTQARLQGEHQRLQTDLTSTKGILSHLQSLLQHSDPYLLIWSFHLENKTISSDLEAPLYDPLPLTLDRKCVLEHIESRYRHFLTETLKSLNHLKRQFSSSPLTMDISSAHPLLRISEDRREAVRVCDRQPRPAHPERFDHWAQVLTAQSFASGSHYWELEAEGFWDIALTYRSIGRKGKEGTAFGSNCVSWSLTRQADGALSAWHARRKTRLGHSMAASSRVGVSLDYGAGSVTFWEAGPALTHLHTFSCTFTQPLCLGFGLYKPHLGSRVAIAKI